MTGAPGVGKTTLIQRIYEQYTAKGLRIAGVTTCEVREGDYRVGFRITDLSSGMEGWLARVEEGPGPRIGKYAVVSEDLENVGVKALEESADRAVDMVLVDEVGPMEMTSNKFRKAIADVLSRNRIIIATVKQHSKYPEVEHASKNSDMVMIELLKENRDEAFRRITSIVDSWTSKRS